MEKEIKVVDLQTTQKIVYKFDATRHIVQLFHMCCGILYNTKMVIVDALFDDFVLKNQETEK